MKNNITMIHCADIHIDAPFMNQEAISAERRRDLRKTFENIISEVLERDTDYLLVSGDLYEHRYAARSTIRWLNEQFERLGDRPAVIIPGNHDPYVLNSWYRSYQWSPNVRILSSESPEYRDERRGVYFYGIGFDTFRQDSLPAQRKPEILPDWINICLFHGTVDMAFTQHPYNPVDSAGLAGMGFDYYALGHFHRKSENLAGCGMVTPGSPEPLGFDEQGEHGAYWVSISKENGVAQRKYSFIPLQQKRYHEISLDVGGVESESRLYSKLEEKLEKHCLTGDIIRINLTGRIPSDFHINVKAIEQNLLDGYSFVQVNDKTGAEYNLDELANERNITGVYVRMMRQRLENATDDDRIVVEKALALGLQALIEGNVEI